MDSLTQFTFGACVGAAVFGRRIGPRKAAVLGGLFGTVPDLDVFYPYADAVDSFVLHRGPTHSLIVQAAAAPIFAEGARRLFQGLREMPRRSLYLGVYAIFATHALLDAITVYGTKLFWPLSREPVGIGSVFIIDPLYTIGLLILTLWAFCQGRWGPRFKRGLSLALGFSTLYLGWSLGAQQIAFAKAEQALGGYPADAKVLASPTPFNTLFWKVLVHGEDRYLNVYVPILGGTDQVRAYLHPRNGAALDCLWEVEGARRIRAFSKDFVRLERDGDRLLLADTRMGLTPAYAFRFALAHVANKQGAAPILPPQRVESVREAGNDLAWLRAGIAGQGKIRDAEAVQQISLPMPDAVWRAASETAC